MKYARVKPIVSGMHIISRLPGYLFTQLLQYSSRRNSSDFDDTRMKEYQKKGLIMYQNTAITIEYVLYKVGVLTKSIEELEQLEKYIIDEEKVTYFFAVLTPVCMIMLFCFHSCGFDLSFIFSNVVFG